MSETEKLLAFVYLTPIGMVQFQPDGTVTMANPVAAQLLMPLAPEPDITNLYRVLSVVAPDLRTRIDGFAEPHGLICDKQQMIVLDGRMVLSLSVNKIDVATFVAIIDDVTEAVRQEARIRADHQRFQAIFDNIRDYAIYTVDLEGRIDMWNRSLDRIGGWQIEDVIGAPVGMFFPTDMIDQSQSIELLDRARQFGKAEAEGWRVRKDGSRFWGSTVAASLPPQPWQTSGYIMVARDLTERKQTEDRLVALSITDPMTGALNRRAGETALREGFRGWKHDGRRFSLLMIDCDHFKSINDTWGHDGGDTVLIALVRLCRENLRDSDTIFRWGGEEFMLLLPETKLGIAQMVAERLRKALETTEIDYGGYPISVTVSIGVVEVCAADNGVDDLVRRVDEALYTAKDAGRNQVSAGA
jgi:diguanylate cyclase (GGDEF)-like protein/PAS domain S-box-containing protein